MLEDADLVNLIETTVKTFGTINILVNNAGLGGGGRENPFNIDVNYVERIYRIKRVPHGVYASLQYLKWVNQATEA